jgi:hypothetical protein
MASFLTCEPSITASGMSAGVAGETGLAVIRGQESVLPAPSFLVQRVPMVSP